jgi:hypothetical protein
MDIYCRNEAGQPDSLAVIFHETVPRQIHDHFTNLNSSYGEDTNRSFPASIARFFERARYPP